MSTQSSGLYNRPPPLRPRRNGATSTVCKVFHGWWSGQKNEQQNNVLSAKKTMQLQGEGNRFDWEKWEVSYTLTSPFPVVWSLFGPVSTVLVKYLFRRHCICPTFLHMPSALLSKSVSSYPEGAFTKNISSDWSIGTCAWILLNK